MIEEIKGVLIKLLKNRKILLKIFLTLCISLDFFSQQIPNYTQYLYNMQILNPAYVGSRAELSMSLLSRQQWVGIPGNPETKTFSINGRTQNGVGVGLTVVNDKIGLSESTNANIDASYTIVTSQFSRLSFGLKGGITTYSNNFANAITPDSDIYASTSGNFPNIGFGAFFYSRKFFMGLSLPYLLETPQFYIEENFKNSQLSKNPNFFFTSGVRLKLSESIMFKPSTMVRYTANLPISIDLNSNFLYRDIIETGVSYRHQSSISALFALIVKQKFRIGYAYDYKFQTLGNNLSTHEIILHIDFNLKRNSRWLEHNRCYF